MTESYQLQIPAAEFQRFKTNHPESTRTDFVRAILDRKVGSIFAWPDSEAPDEMEGVPVIPIQYAGNKKEVK